MIVATVLALTCLSSLTADSRSAITGRVTDSQGAAIAKARVLIHKDSSSDRLSQRPTLGTTQNMDVSTDTTQDISELTDASGVYSISVQAGFYDVFVSAPMFTPAAAKIVVKQGHQATFSIKLAVDPLVSKELGGMEVYAGPEKR